MKANTIAQYHHIYFIGIGGISMSGLAEILWDRGLSVSGTDMRKSKVTVRLEELGIPVNYGHKKENITEDVDLVVYTAAVKEDNPELVSAKERGLAIMDRAELLGRIMADYQYSVAISGTHGKTTTTSMVSEILLYAKHDPTITVGGILPVIGSNTKIGKSPFFVAEACEYCDSFLKFFPYIAVILNIEEDHLDYFKDLAHIRRSFASFGKNVPSAGKLLINHEIKDFEHLVKDLSCRVETYGLETPQADWNATNLIHEPNGISGFDVSYHGEVLGRIHLPVPGDHNISNALAACGAAHTLGVSMEHIIGALNVFQSADRRFQFKGKKDGITVVDDYAHHPTEIKATLQAAKNLKYNRIWCVFQPHTYTRTYTLLPDFASAFVDADEVVLADIFAAREKDTGLVSSKDLEREVKKQGKSVTYIESFEKIIMHLQENCKEGDLIMTVGAGDIYLVGEDFLKA